MAALICGIFGFVLQKPIKLVKAFRVLEKLETHQYPSETRLVGDYGAGIAIINNNRTVFLEKIGKVTGSPAKSLSKICKTAEASVLIGHVRKPSPWFMKNAKFKEPRNPMLRAVILI